MPGPPILVTLYALNLMSGESENISEEATVPYHKKEPDTQQTLKKSTETASKYRSRTQISLNTGDMSEAYVRSEVLPESDGHQHYIYLQCDSQKGI
jgi:hypothetical protein